MQSIFIETISQLNSREQATGIWFLVVLVLMVSTAKLRESLYHLVRAAFATKLIILFGSFLLYLCGVCWVLWHLQFWTFEQLTATALWYCLSGVALLGGAIGSTEGDNYFRQTFRGLFAATAVFEFLVVAFTFHLAIELVLVPILVVLGLMLAVAETDDKYRPTRRLFEGLFILIGLYLLWKSVGQVWSEPDEFWTTATGRIFVLPIMLTLTSIPFVYLWFCYSQIETARIRIDLKTFQSDELKRYARKRFFLIFMLRPWLMNRAVRQFQTLPAETNADVDRIISEILQYERDREAPPVVDPINGWSPFLATEFLAEDGLRTKDFHADGFGGYFASSEYLDLDDHILPSRAAFYLEGEQGLVSKLKLKGSFRDEFDTHAAEERFLGLAQRLIVTSGTVEQADAQKTFTSVENLETQVGHTEIICMIKRFSNERGFDVSISLSRGLGM